MRIKYEVTNEPFSEWLKRKNLNIIEFRKDNFERIICLLKENNKWSEEVPGMWDDFCYDFNHLTKDYYKKWWEEIGFIGAPDCFVWNEKTKFCTFIEFKSKNDELRAPQIEWLIRNKGMPYMVFRSLSERKHPNINKILTKSEV